MKRLFGSPGSLGFVLSLCLLAQPGCGTDENPGSMGTGGGSGSGTPSAGAGGSPGTGGGTGGGSAGTGGAGGTGGRGGTGGSGGAAGTGGSSGSGGSRPSDARSDTASRRDSGSSRADMGGAASDTWETYAKGFFGIYCASCHNDDNTGFAGRNYRMLPVVTAEKAKIACGLAKSTADWTARGCSGFPPARQFPVGGGPKPSDADRDRILRWIDSGTP